MHLAELCKQGYDTGVPALQHYLRDEIPKRGWTMAEFAQRAHLSLSNAYLIVRDGKDNVRQDTFDDIAAALSMSHAELAVAIGKGPASDDPALATVHALVRDVARGDVGTVERIIRTFARNHPATDARHSKRDRSGPSKPHETPPESPLMYPYGGAYPTLAFAGG